MTTQLATAIAAVRHAFRYTPMARVYYAYRDRRETAQWIGGQRRGPAPHALKRATVAEYSRKFGLSILIETGTYVGLMLREQRHRFQRLVSIELDPKLAALNRWQFRRDIAAGRIELREGDSATELPLVLADLDEPALFWLDAHYSGGPTAQAELDTPIVAELSAILSHKHRANHVILVDDAHEFTGSGDYPTLEAVRNLVARLSPTHGLTISDNVIRITPGSP